MPDRELSDEISRLQEENAHLKRTLARNGIDWEQEISATEKIALFRNLFRGRQDVYPVYWRSSKGTSGYSPACGNEWQAGICHKPKIKCSDCLNQRFLPLTDRVIYEHLTGKHTIGIYPLMEDDTCFFLAVDFDGAHWKDDARSYLASCDELGIPAALEISRSGDGAHVWIFFSERVSARDARNLGTAIISRTCNQTRQLTLSSYDRLFPNQDVLPRGGFGNLIALPLQWELREEGRTVFVDHELTPFPDQWSFLASLKRMSGLELASTLAAIGTNNDALDIPHPEGLDNADDPWLHLPAPPPALPGPLPASVELVVANGIYIAKEDLTQPLSNRLIRIAAFQNPEFHRAQALRMPVWNKPRVIGCAENFPKHIALPRGCLDEIIQLLETNGIRTEIRDERTAGEVLPFTFRGSLRPGQETAVQALLVHDTGVLSAPTGSGKTVIAAAVIARRKVSTLILVHRTQLMRQWEEQLSAFLSLPDGCPGTIGSGKDRSTGHVDIAVMQSLARRDDLAELFTNYGQIIVDECHHISAFTFESILKQSHARFVLGLTATPFRRDGHQPIIFMQCGPLRHASSRPKSDLKKMEIIPRSMPAPLVANESGIQDVFRALVQNPARNRRIAQDIRSAFSSGRNILVLTERTAHIEYLKSELDSGISPCFVLHGRLPRKQRESVLAEIAALPESTPHVILATGRLVGEGFDHPRLDTLILAMPISWKGTLQQYAGRLHREHSAKTDVQVFDYVEEANPRLFRMWEKRRRGYEAMGYRIRIQEELF